MSRLFQRFGNRKIVTPNGSATQEFDRGLQKAFDQLETQIADLTQIVLDIQAAQAAADAADTKARAHMDDMPEVTVTGDYTGTLAVGQLPMNIAAKRYDGTTNVSATSAWTATVESGDASVSIGAATGVLTVTSITTDSVIRVESVRDGLTLRKKQVVRVALSDPPNTGSSGGGGSSSWSDTTLGTTSTTSMTVISDELTVTVGSSGTVNLSAPLYVTTTADASSAGAHKVYGIWQWWDGASWVDLGTETASSPDCTVFHDTESDVYVISQNGSLNVSSSKTGLVTGASEKFRLEARNNSGTLTMYYNGTAAATTS